MLILNDITWKRVPGVGGYREYEISNTGLIRSILIKNGITEYRILKPQISWNGRLRIHLLKECKNKHLSIHRLVAEAFLPNPLNKPQINHIDGNPLNNNVSNLEWCTASENLFHAFRSGLKKPTSGGINGMRVLNDEQVLEIFNSDKKQKELCEKFNVSTSAISLIKTGRNWSHLTKKNYNRRYLTDEEVLKIRSLNIPQKEIAKLFNISPNNISTIKSGKTFKHLL